jgi:hypothetical protein
MIVFLMVGIAIAIVFGFVDHQAHAQVSKSDRQIVDMEVVVVNSQVYVWRMWSDGTVERMVPTTDHGLGEWIRVDK